jgi:hypothetical protein
MRMDGETGDFVKREGVLGFWELFVEKGDFFENFVLEFPFSDFPNLSQYFPKTANNSQA